MSLIRVRFAQPHALLPGVARARVEEAIDELSARFPGYHIQRRWSEDGRGRLAFTFAKAGKGEGSGTASLEEGRVDVEVDAHYNLPLLVPVVLAEKVVRDEIAKLFAARFA